MKLVFAIVQDSSAEDVIRALSAQHYFVTRLASSGGFLKAGNTTLISGVEEKEVDTVVSIIRRECGPHQKITVNVPYITDAAIVNYTSTAPMSVEVGGATIFVLDVDRFEKF